VQLEVQIFLAYRQVIIFVKFVEFVAVFTGHEFHQFHEK